MLVDTDHFCGVSHIAVGQLGAMHQPVFLDAHVDKAAEVRDVRHDARQLHPFMQISQRAHCGVKGKHLDGLPAVAPGLIKLLHDVGQGGHPHVLRHVMLQADAGTQFLVCDQLVDRAVHVGGHTLHQRIALRMDSRIVQRVRPLGNAQEAGTLLKSLCSHAGHLKEFTARSERTVLGTVVHDVLGQLRSQAGNVSEQVLACRVHIHTHQIHTVYHRLVKRLFQSSLVYVVLVLPHADGFRINLHQLGQRVHQPAPDGHSSPHRDIVIGKLLTRRLRRRVDGSSVFTHHEGLHPARICQAGHKLFRLATGRPVADGDGLDGILFDQGREFARGLCPLVARGMRINGLIVQQSALRVEAHDLASRPVARVDGQHAFLTQRRCQQELAQVGRKHTNGFFVSPLLAPGCKLCLDGRFQQAFVSIGHSRSHLLPASVTRTDKLTLQAFQRFGVVGRRDVHLQETLGLAPANGQQTVGRTTLQGFTEIEIIMKLRSFFLLALHHLGRNHGPAGKLCPHRPARPFVFAHLLGQDVAGAFQRVVHVFHIAFHESPHPLFQPVLTLHEQHHGQGFQSFLPGRLGSGLTLRLVGQIKVFQFRRVPTLLDTFPQFVSHFSLPLDGGHDGCFALDQFFQPFVPIAHFAHFHLVKRTGRFLPVAADERDGSPFVEQFQRVAHLPGCQPQRFFYNRYKLFVHVFSCL